MTPTTRHLRVLAFHAACAGRTLARKGSYSRNRRLHYEHRPLGVTTGWVAVVWLRGARSFRRPSTYYR